MPPQSIAFIYKNLQCPYSLQPPTSSTYSDPAIPALKPKGFVIWQTIQLLLGPAEHVPFIQNALHVFEVHDPDNGDLLPKYIPTSAFPAQPDPQMVRWHADVSERLRREAEQVVPADGRPLSRESTDSVSQDGTTISNERSDAAGFFANPLYRGKDGKPTIVSQLTKAPGKVLQGGKSVALNVFQGGKLIVSPHLFSQRKKSHSRSPSRDRDDRHRQPHSQSHTTKRITDPHGQRPSSPRKSSHDTGRRPPRRSTPSPTTSEEEDEKLERERRRHLRRHRSQESPNSSRTREAAPRRHKSLGERQARHSSPGSGDNQEIKPSHSPPLAVKMAQQRYQQQSQQGPPADYFSRRSSHQPQFQAQPGSDPNRPPMPSRTSSLDQQTYDPRHDLRRQSRSKSYQNVRAPSPGSEDKLERQDTPAGPILGAWPEDEEQATGYQEQFSPNTQEEWEVLRRSASNQHEDSSGSASVSKGRRQSKPVNGVSGRRYPDVAPWT